MTIPFLNLFKKLTSRLAPETAEHKPTASPARVAKKPNGVAARNAFVCAAGPISKRSRRTFAARQHTTA
jgi:hypothetical protein